MTGQFQLIFKRRFLPLFITQFLGAFNDNVYKNALVILITYKLSDQLAISGPVLVSLAAGIFILPFFLFSALAGQIADKYEKSSVIKWIKFIEIFIMLFAVLAISTNSVFLLFSILFLTGTQSTFFGPLKYSILPQHLYKDELIGGNA